jgi:hypothetical protein
VLAVGMNWVRVENGVFSYDGGFVINLLLDVVPHKPAFSSCPQKYC